MASEDKEEGRRVDRRGFFSEGLRKMLRPVGDLIEERLKGFEEARWTDSKHPATPPSSHRPAGGPAHAPAPIHTEGGSLERFLRPPGALPEEEFLSTCATSGECVGACPVTAIRPATSDDTRLDGRPVIEANLQACVVCDDLACMKACPTGALQEVPVEAIRMGTAELDEELCLRSHGEDCQICVDKCPLGSAALELVSFDSEVLVHAEGCVGCGVCQMYCPTEPAALEVRPRERLGGAD